MCNCQMFKNFCDSCKKVIKDDHVALDIDLKTKGHYGRYDFCIGCVRFLPNFLRKVTQEKVTKKESKK